MFRKGSSKKAKHIGGVKLDKFVRGQESDKSSGGVEESCAQQQQEATESSSTVPRGT